MDVLDVIKDVLQWAVAAAVFTDDTKAAYAAAQSQIED